MSNLPDVAPVLAEHLSGPIEVGEPDAAPGFTVYPLFGPPAALDYVAFASAHEQVAITELDGGASVNDLTVTNDSGNAVLLYEGEEILGAQQNRVLDISVLVAAHAKTRIPVSCVERGRWDGRRHRERFHPSRQAADPKLRRIKNRRARFHAEAIGEARSDQAEVWKEVSTRGAELQAASPTDAMSDFFDHHRDGLERIRAEIRLHDGQCGSVAVIAGRIAILDFVGRADVYAALHPAIVEGYALDALAQKRRGEGSADHGGVDASTVRGFTLLACDSPAGAGTPGPGLGTTTRFAANGVDGSALIHEGELVQLTAYPSDADEEPAGPGPRAHRVNRPSRRSGRRGR
jgi:hypothetical protein